MKSLDNEDFWICNYHSQSLGTESLCNCIIHRVWFTVSIDTPRIAKYDQVVFEYSKTKLFFFIYFKNMVIHRSPDLGLLLLTKFVILDQFVFAHISHLFVWYQLSSN